MAHTIYITKSNCYSKYKMVTIPRAKDSLLEFKISNNFYTKIWSQKETNQVAVIRSNTCNWGSQWKGMCLLITGMRRKSLWRVIYFNIFMPFAIGMSTSARIRSISGPSAFKASITCLADRTEITAETQTPISVVHRNTK